MSIQNQIAQIIEEDNCFLGTEEDSQVPAKKVIELISRSYLPIEQVKTLLEEQKKTCADIKTMDKYAPFRDLGNLPDRFKEAILDAPSPQGFTNVFIQKEPT